MTHETTQRTVTGPEGRIPDLPDGVAGEPDQPDRPEQPGRRPGELSLRELARWSWRQLTSMRTALILLLLLALAAVPGSLIPQSGVDSIKASNWQDAHTTLTPIYSRLGLFDVYSTPWFGAIYVLLMVSLVGCIVPRLRVYWRGLRAQPPATPRHLLRLPDSASYTTPEEPEVVLARARTLLKRQRYRIRKGEGDGSDGSVSSERGYLREAGNLVFHLSVILVLVGFAMGSMLGYKGGVIVVVGKDAGFTNTLSQYDDFDPGSLFSERRMDPFTFHIDDFKVQWLNSGPRQGMAKGFQSELTYCQRTDCSDAKRYDLRVNHPLKIGSTEVFLIGHGYAPVITVRDGQGNVAYSGPTVFLPQNQTFFSFGVVKAPAAKPEQIGLQGVFYPTFIMDDKGNPATLMGNDLNPLISMHVYAGELNASGAPQSVYALDTSHAKQVMNPAKPSQPLRLDMKPGQTVTLPGGLGSVTFDKVVRWNRLQISQSPGKGLALGGVILCLIGLLGSLFIRPRRVWVRARRAEGGTLVEVAALDRSGGGDTDAVVRSLVEALQEDKS
ncbi:cytochrome c biogenesis protein ResB [Nocardioides sp. AN3]